MKKKRSSISKYWTWISFVVFLLVIALMATALIKKQSPGVLLSQLFSTDKTLYDQDLNSLNKDELIELVTVLRTESDSLRGLINDFKERYGHTTATVDVDNNTLNMRAEPSLRSSVLFRIPNQSIVTIIAYDTEEVYIDGAKGRWCKVNYAGSIGWVWGNYLIIDN